MTQKSFHFVGYLVIVFTVSFFHTDSVRAEVKCADFGSCQTCVAANLTVANSTCGWFKCDGETTGTFNETCMEKNGTVGAKNCTPITACAVSNSTDNSVKPTSSNRRTSVIKASPPSAIKSHKPGSSTRSVNTSLVKTPSTFVSSSHSISPVDGSSSIQPAPSSIILPSTAAPTTFAPSASQPHVEPGKRFDGASFIGGMILSAGLILLGYFGWQWYRTRSKSYHSL